MIRRPPRSTLSSSSAASDVYKRQCVQNEGDLVSLEALKVLPGLRSLELYFPSAILSTYSPWHQYYYRQDDLYTANVVTFPDIVPEHNRIGVYKFPCQAKMCDMIMRFAAVHFTHIELRLTGFSKTWVKKKWEKAMQESTADGFKTWLEAQKDEFLRAPALAG